MGEWYLIGIKDILGVDKSATYIRMVNGKLVPEYSSAFVNTTILEKYGIDKVLVKQVDVYGTEFREMSTGLILGSIGGFNSLAINKNNYKSATNEELFEYINHMQEKCGIEISRFDVLSYELNSLYNLYKPVLKKVKQNIKMRKINKIKSTVAKSAKLVGYNVTSPEVKRKEQMNQRLTLIKGDK